MNLISNSNSVMAILYDIFPTLIAEHIYKYYIIILKLDLLNQYKHSVNQVGLNGILNIKDINLAYWIVTYESIINQNAWYNPFALKNINGILLNNHLCLKGWKKRWNNNGKPIKNYINCYI